MVNITLAIPDSLHKKLKSHSEIRWSEVIRRLLERNIEQMELMDRILKNSKLTQEDVGEISEKVDSSVAKKFDLK